MNKFSMLGMLRSGLDAMNEPEVEEPKEPPKMSGLEVVLNCVLPLANAARRAAEIEAREEEIHQARLAAIQPPAAPPYRTVKDVAEALEITETAAKKFLSENQKRLEIEHEAGKKWKLTEKQFERCKAIKSK